MTGPQGRWPAVAALTAIAVTIGIAFVRRQPLGGTTNYALLGGFLAAMCGGLGWVAMVRWSSRRYLLAWVAAAALSATAATICLYAYEALWDTSVGSYQGDMRVVGDEYTAVGARYKETSSGGSVDELLFAAAGDPTVIWTAASIERVRSRMRLLYLASLPLITLAIVATAQALQCVVRTGRKADATADADPHRRIQVRPAAGGSRSLVQNRQVRILFLASNPETTSHLELEEELRSLETELRGVRFRDDVALTTGHAVRPDDLVRLLRQERPTIVHFSGHGSPAGIVLHTDSGHVAVSGEALARLFRDRGVELIVLNACYSEPQASLLEEAVPAVVGTADAVGDEAARRFSTAFYRTLGNGHSLKDAFRDGGDAVAVHELRDVFLAHGNLERTICGPMSARRDSTRR